MVVVGADSVRLNLLGEYLLGLLHVAVVGEGGALVVHSALHLLVHQALIVFFFIFVGVLGDLEFTRDLRERRGVGLLECSSIARRGGVTEGSRDDRIGRLFHFVADTGRHPGRFDASGVLVLEAFAIQDALSVCTIQI